MAGPFLPGSGWWMAVGLGFRLGPDIALTGIGSLSGGKIPMAADRTQEIE
ncbi:MAG TPA: hypothetical protein VGM42_03780 [Rhodopila sp.]|jgi:hypothetical protein